MTPIEQRPDYDRPAPHGDSAAWHKLLSVTLHIFYPVGSSEGIFDLSSSPSGKTGIDLGKNRKKKSAENYSTWSAIAFTKYLCNCSIFV